MARFAFALLMLLIGCAKAEGQPAPAAIVLEVEPNAAPTAAPAVAEVSTEPEAQVHGCPREMARVGRFCIDRWEAHLATRAEDGALAPWPHSRRPEAGVRYLARSEPDVMPQGFISRVESAAACKLAGKRLCSFNEWRRACQQKTGLRYPYGHRERNGACNSGKLHLLPKLFGGDARHWDYERHFNAAELALQPGYLAKTGEHGDCAGESGVFDLVGNLHEWVSGTVDESFVESLEAEPVERIEIRWQEGNGIFVGGFFSTTDQLGPGCYYTTVAHEPSYHDYSTGFRCCRRAGLTR